MKVFWFSSTFHDFFTFLPGIATKKNSNASQLEVITINEWNYDTNHDVFTL